jgi:hypothetical protein
MTTDAIDPSLVAPLEACESTRRELLAILDQMRCQLLRWWREQAQLLSCACWEPASSYGAREDENMNAAGRVEGVSESKPLS